MRRNRFTKVAGALVFIQLGMVALACPMPAGQAMPDEGTMAANCAESHGDSESDRMPNELCKARMAADSTALIRDRPSDVSTQAVDAGAVIASTVHGAPVSDRPAVAFEPPEKFGYSPPNLKYRVIRI